jgi:hypothetical protein
MRRGRRAEVASSGSGDCFSPRYRLRVGEIRVFYDISGTTVEILAIVAKSEADTWLAQFANLE